MSTLSGFKGGFYALNKRSPTEQEIFDEGVREGKARAAPASPAESALKKLVDTYFNNNCGENLFNRMTEAHALLAASMGGEP